MLVTGPDMFHLVILGLLALLSGATCQDTTNYAPRWVDDLQRVWVQGIREDTAVGTILGRLSALDPENDRVSYSVEFNDVFGVNEENGDVTLLRQLDREVEQFHQVTFYAQDSYGSRTTVAFDVVVIDVNDHAPEFLELPYEASANEHLLPGSVVFSGLLARDVDSGLNAAMDFACVEDGTAESRIACDTFAVQAQPGTHGYLEGTLVLKQNLDYETKRSYVMMIRVSDFGSPSLSSVATLPISITDEQDFPPQFINAPFTLTISENTPAGTSVGIVQARDQDRGNPSPIMIAITDGEYVGDQDRGNPSPIMIAITDDPLQYFTLSETTAFSGAYKSIIRLNKAIDREAVPHGYSFLLQATEQFPDGSYGNPVETIATVTVMDANDNQPTFDRSTYEVTIPEGLPQGASLAPLNMIVTDLDADSNNHFELSLEGDDRHVFELSETRGVGQAIITLTVQDPNALDYEVPENRQRTLKVVAREAMTTQRYSSTATIIVDLFDVNDNGPKFAQDEYEVTIRENHPYGQHVITVTATDRDSGSNALIFYELQGEDSEYFHVDMYTGEITLIGHVEFDRTKNLDLTIVARDSGGIRASSAIAVSLVESPTSAVPVTQNAANVTEVIVGTSTLNPRLFLSSPGSSSVVFSIISGNTENNAFQINQTSGELYLMYPITLQDTQALNGYFLLQISATDVTSGQSDMVFIRVNYKEMNLYAPVFSQPSYSTTVSEIATAGTTVYTVLATDQDGGSDIFAGDITYTLLQGGRDNFQIDTMTGVVTTRSTADLTIENFGSSYTMLVTATDTGSPRRTGTAELIVMVTDVNNQSPVFRQNLYMGTISEGATSGTSVLTATANDVDSTSTLSYRILTNTIIARNNQQQLVTNTASFNYMNAFAVSSTSGEISTVLSTLEPDTVSEVEFVLEVQDISAVINTPQTATATVRIYIETTGAPSMSFASMWTASVRENTTVNSEITGLTLVANTPDGSDVSFAIVDGSDVGGYFLVHSYTGKVTLNRALDYEALNPPELQFQVRASSPTTTAYATVIVTVLNVNDNIPSFLLTGYSFEISESQAPGSLVGIIVATDADKGNYGEIMYSITGSGSYLFNIDPTTGYLTVAPGATFNSAMTPYYLLTVEASDDPGGATSLAYRTQLNISIFDDNTAVFVSTGYQAVLSDTTVANQRVLTLTLLDASSTVYYSITAGNNDQLFSIDSSSGSLYTQRSLVNSARPSAPYQLTVTASDTGNPPTVASTIVSIWVLTPTGGSMASPIFLVPDPNNPATTAVEEEPTGTMVTTVTAYNPATASTSGVQYSLVPIQDYNKFSLDSSSGVLVNVQRLDRETQGTYQVTVKAQLGTYSAEVTMPITLIDIDDNDPTFVCPGYSNPKRVSVRENQAIGTLVTTVSACDNDAPPNNLIYYRVVCGNEPSAATSSLRPFELNPTTGTLSTTAVLDRELQAEYRLCVKATADPNYNPVATTFEAAENDMTVQRYIVSVIDEDDNTPSFGYQNATFTAAVLAEAPFHTAVVQVQAYDIDSDEIQYSLRNLRFYPTSEPGASQSAEGTFTIDSTTGMVYTNLVHYLDYEPGYFYMEVVATSDGVMGATSTLDIYLIRGAQLMRFVFKNGYEPEEVIQTQNQFTSDVSNEVGARVTVSSLRYHITDDGGIDFERTDMCFHVVDSSSSTILDPSQVYQLFGSHYPDLVPVYDEFGVDAGYQGTSAGIDRCDVHTTTVWWSGYYYLWWILIALAVLLVVLAILCMICLASKYKDTKDQLPYKPYTMLDPFVIPYEYEETTVHM